MFIDAFMLPGNIVVDYLGLSDCVSRTIKLSAFINQGEPATTVVPGVGFFKWEESLLDILPVKRRDSSDR